MAEKGNTGLLVLGAAALAALAYSQKDKIVSSVVVPTKFLFDNYKFAKESEAATGVPALVTLVQAALESGYGQHAPGNNFFGIKAGSSWTGNTQKLKTWECGSSGDPKKDGIKDEVIQIYPPGSSLGAAAVQERSWYSSGMGCSNCTCGLGAAGCNARGFYSYRVWGIFRSYNSARDSFIDHGLFLRNNSRYSKAFLTKDPKAFATEVAKAGYATDPTYATKLAAMIDVARIALKV